MAYGEASLLLGRGAAYGGVVGALCGGALGAFLGVGEGLSVWPLILGGFGTYLGAGIGLAAGCADGALIAGALRLRPGAGPGRPRPGRRPVRLVAAGTTALIAGLVALLVDGWWGTPDNPAVVAASVALLTAVGFGAGPLVVYGPTPTRLLARSVRILQAGVLAGGTCGTLAGVVLGLATYPPTAPFAAVEAGLIGTGAGGALAALVITVSILPRLRAAVPATPPPSAP